VSALSERNRSLKPSRVGLIAIYLFIASQILRTLTAEGIQDRFTLYLGLLFAYLVLYSAILLRPALRREFIHLYFVVQSAIILVLISLNPELDYVTAYFVPLGYQSALFFTGTTLWLWVGGLVFLTCGPLMFYHGVIHGISLPLTTIAGVIVLPAFVVVNQEIDKARVKSQTLLGDLQKTRQQLESYAGQVEELTTIEERNRLARGLHDTVSQLIFSITLTARSAQILLERDPARVPEQLGRLQEMTGDALSELRSLITQLRPPQTS
jgi:signal transduction histidine kinase